MKLKLSSVDRIAASIIKQEDIDGYNLVKYIMYFTYCFLLSFYNIDCILVKFKTSKGSIIIDRKRPIDLSVEPIQQGCLVSYVIKCVCKNLKGLKADEINKMITVIGSPYHTVISQGKTKRKSLKNILIISIIYFQNTKLWKIELQQHLIFLDF